MSDRFARGRLTEEEALTLFQSDDLIELGEHAHQKRLELNDPQIVTYVVDRNVNYSNVCTAGCKFCAFSRTAGDEDGYVLSQDELFRKIEELVSVGGTQVLLQGGLHPELPFSFYLEMLSGLKRRFDTGLHAFSAPEIVFFSERYAIPVSEIIRELRTAGLDTIPGGGAEVLSDRVRRQMSDVKCSVEEWLAVHEEAHRQGMRTTATMMFGHIETIQERVEHLRLIRDLQDRTGGFTAFIPWTFQSRNTALEHVPEAGAVEYLKTLAISRLFLDNVRNLQASFVTQGKSIGQMALFFGANDMGGTMMEENVVAATGVSHCSHEKELRELVEDAGFTARKRDTLYHYLS